MKICYLADAGSIHTRRWVEYFADRGNEIHLISLGCPDVRSLHAHTYFFEKKFGTYGYLSGLPKIKKLIKKLNPQILHAHYIINYGLLGALTNFHPFVVSAWGGDILSEQKAYRIFLLSQMVDTLSIHYTLKKADAITTHSHYLFETILNFGDYRKKSHLIKWGVDLSKFAKGLEIDFLREKLSLGDSPVILSMRMFKPLYNIDIFVKSIPLVLNEIPKVKFILKEYQGGTDPCYKTHLKTLIKELHISKSVKLIGDSRHEEIPFYLNLSDVSVSIPSSDGMPQSVQESMACGSIPVVSVLPQLKELITHKINGLVVPLRDEKALAKAIVSILRNRELKEKIRKANRALMEKEYNQDKEMINMENLYHKLIK